jgi:hypothetical protein
MEKQEIQYEYIYLIREREFIKSSEEIYKIGRTCQADFKRFDGYPKNSHLILFIDVPDCKLIEKIIIKKFKIHFQHKKNIGNEYFEGNKSKMIKEMIDIVQNFKPKPVDQEKEKIKQEREKLAKEREKLEQEKEKIRKERERLELEKKEKVNQKEKPKKKKEKKKKEKSNK